LQRKLVDAQLGRFGEEGALHPRLRVLDNVAGHRSQVSQSTLLSPFSNPPPTHRVLFNDWNAGYEKLTDMIVPRSSQLITQDSDFGLFNVTLFKKVVEEFKLHAREKKFVVREFTYNEEELAAGKNEITKLVTDKKKQFVS
jgi:hypothetical protein